jgi:hypothetical protein
MPFMPRQCAPQTCNDKPAAAECAPPAVYGVPNGTGGNAYAGRQYLQEAGQSLLRVTLVCEGDWWWTPGPWSSADDTTGTTVHAYWSCYPRRAAAVSYETQHS